jgi:hypothetical protein
MSLNSVNHLIFLMVKCSVLFEVKVKPSRYTPWRSLEGEEV